MFEEIIDISPPLQSGMLIWPGDASTRIERSCSIGIDSECNITDLSFTTHTGAHLDAPLHFIENGQSIDDLPLSRFISDALVVEVAGDSIQPSHLPDNIPLDGKSLLFKTRNSELYRSTEFTENYVYMVRETADRLLEAKVNLVGIDYLSIDRYDDEDHPCHYRLLGNDVLILEGIDLGHVAPGAYTLVAFPLKIENGDGSPVRAVLIPKGDLR